MRTGSWACMGWCTLPAHAQAFAHKHACARARAGNSQIKALKAEIEQAHAAAAAAAGSEGSAGAGAAGAPGSTAAAAVPPALRVEVGGRGAGAQEEDLFAGVDTPQVRRVAFSS